MVPLVSFFVSVADAYFWTVLRVEAAGDETEEDVLNLVRDKDLDWVFLNSTSVKITFQTQRNIFQTKAKT